MESKSNNVISMTDGNKPGNTAQKSNMFEDEVILTDKQKMRKQLITNKDEIYESNHSIRARSKR